MIKVRSKTLFIPAEEQSIGAVGEADSTVREFHIDRVSGDGVDLANLLFKLNIRYAGVREIDRSDLEKVVTDNAIILRWLISSVTLRNAGTAFLQLDAFDETGSCRWKSYPGAVYIEKSLGNTEIPSNTLSELEQLEKKFAKVGEGEAARVEAEKKRVSAEEKREEAEGKRNTSLANIIAEEEKIKAVSAEAKGYKDSVSADKQEITTMKNEAVSAKNTAQQHANAAEASKNSTITEGTKIKEAVTALKNEANTAKADAVNAKNEAVSAKNGANAIKGEVLALKNEANTIKGEVQALKNETESRIQSAESNIQNQVMNATSSANMAERASQQAEGYKMEAGVSAEKAKESETKTLEALKKAQEGGKVAGVTSDEMHSYVDTAVGKIKSGITEAEAIAVVGSELKKKQVPQKDYKALTKTLVSGENSTLENIGENTLVDGKTLSSALSGVAEGTKERFLDKSGLNGAVTPIVESIVKGKIDGEKVTNDEVNYYKLLDDFQKSYGAINIPKGKLATTDALYSVFAAIRTNVFQRLDNCYKRFEEEQYVGGKSINSRVGEMEGQIVTNVINTLRNRLREGKYGRIKIFDYIDIPTTIPGTEKMRFYVMDIDKDLEKNSIDFISFDYPDRIIMSKTELDAFGTASIDKINKLIENKVKSDERIPMLKEMLERGIIAEVNRTPFSNTTPKMLKIWTLDYGDVAGVPFPFGQIDGMEFAFLSPKQLEFFEKIKRVKDVMKADLYLTSTSRPDFIALIDKTLIARKRTIKEIFGELPAGTSQEDKLKLRPAIPICFRICAN